MSEEPYINSCENLITKQPPPSFKNRGRFGFETKQLPPFFQKQWGIWLWECKRYDNFWLIPFPEAIAKRKVIRNKLSGGLFLRLLDGIHIKLWLSHWSHVACFAMSFCDAVLTSLVLDLVALFFTYLTQDIVMDPLLVKNILTISRTLFNSLQLNSWILVWKFIVHTKELLSNYDWEASTIKII